MQKLLSSDNLSAESHLKALFDSSDKREFLGASTAADSYDRAADVRHLGPGQIQNTGLEQNALKRHGDNSLSAMQRKGGELIGKQAISLKDKTEGASLLSTSLNAGLKDFNRKFDEQEETNSVGLMNQDAMTELRRDRIDGASVNYLNEQKGMSTILLNLLPADLVTERLEWKRKQKTKTNLLLLKFLSVREENCFSKVPRGGYPPRRVFIHHLLHPKESRDQS